MQLVVGQPDAPKQRRGHGDNLHVGRRIHGADALGAQLVELPGPAGLGPLVAEHGARVPQLDGLAAPVQPPFQVCPDRARGAFGPQRQAALAAVLEGVHLLFHHVGVFADAPRANSSVCSKMGVRISP